MYIDIPSQESQNGTQLVGWVSDPEGRGTWGIIASCVATLILCIWSSLHLNIPPKGETRLQWWMRNAHWLALGVFVPELVVLAAWRQWQSARALGHNLDEVFGEEHSNTQKTGTSVSTKPTHSQNPDNHPKRHEWTLTHGNFAEMGGFAFDVNDDDQEPFLPLHIKRLTLTSHGVLLLAQCGHLPDVNEADLKDKSKSDGLAKAIILLQVSWFFAQTVGRLVVGLPVTLLEVNTIAHTTCAGFIFLLWWTKLRDVNQPIVLRGDWTAPLAAYMYMTSRMSDTRAQKFSIPKSWYTPELKHYVYIPPSPADGIEGELRKRPLQHGPYPNNALRVWLGFGDPHHILEDLPDALPIPIPDPHAHHDDVELQSTLSTATASLLPSSTSLLPLSASHTSQTSHTPTTPTSVDLRRHALAIAAIESHPALSSRFTTTSPSSPHLNPHLTQLVVPSALNWPSDSQIDSTSGQKMGIVLWCASILYGGIHMAAWFSYFPTSFEQTTWRVCAAYIASSGWFWLVCNVVAFMLPRVAGWYHRVEAMQINHGQIAVLGVGSVVCGVVYVVARVYLVVEAVISLRDVPRAVYQTPDWAQAVPHL